MEFTIYSIGDSEFLEQVLIALAMLVGIEDFRDMVKVGMLVGVLATVLSAIARGGREIELQHVLIGYILWATMFVPTATVNIEDTYMGDVRVVDNVPMGPAAAGGMISLIGYKLTTLFEVAYDPIVPRTTETEFAESLRILSDVRSKSMNAAYWQALNVAQGGGFADLRKSWVNYIEDCSLKKLDLGLATADGFRSETYSTVLELDSTLFGTRLYVNSGDMDGQELNCADAWDSLTAATDTATDAFRQALNTALKFNGSNLPTGVSAIDKTQTALEALTGAAADANEYVKASIIEPIFLEAASGKYDQLEDVAGATMINQAIQQRSTQWAAEQTLFMTIVRPMMAFFEAFIYAVSPVMAFVIVLGHQGVVLAGKYFMMLLWIQLWMPILAIINLYIYMAAGREVAAYSAMDTMHWASFYAVNSAADVAQTWMATGGMLASSTPAIALMLIYGSSITATHLAGRLNGGDYINEKYATPDASNTPPLLQQSSAWQHSPGAGLARPGDAFMSINVADAFAGSQSSAHAEGRQTLNRLSGSLANDISSGTDTSLMQTRARDVAHALRNGDSESYKIVADMARDYVKANGLSNDHVDTVTGIIAANAGASLGLDGEHGLLKAIGKGLGAVGLKLPNANIGANATAQDSSRDAEGRQASERFSKGLSELSGTTTSTAFEESLAKSFATGEQWRRGNAWRHTATEHAAQEYSVAKTTEDRAARQAAHARDVGLTGGFALNVAANQTIAAGNAQRAAGSRGIDDELLQGTDDMARRFGHDSRFARILRENERNYTARVGGDERQGRVMAAYQTLMDSRVYAERNDQESLGMHLAYRTFLSSQGMEPPPEEYFKAPAAGLDAIHAGLADRAEGHPGRAAPVGTLRPVDPQPAGPGSIAAHTAADAAANSRQFAASRATLQDDAGNALYESGRQSMVAYIARDRAGHSGDAPMGTYLAGLIDKLRTGTEGIISNRSRENRLEEAEAHGLSRRDGSAQYYAALLDAGFMQDAKQEMARAGEWAGFDTDANHTSPELTAAMNQMKRSVVPVRTDAQGYELDASGAPHLDAAGNGIQHWHYEDGPSGPRVVLSDTTLDEGIETFAGDIHRAAWTGQHASGYLAEGNRVLNMINPDR